MPLNFTWRRISLIVFTYRKLILIMIVVSIILSSVALGVLFGYFGYHVNKDSNINTELLAGMQRYQTQPDISTRVSGVNNYVKKYVLDDLGPSNYQNNNNDDLRDGSIIIIGSSADKGSLNMVNVSENKWGMVGSNKILYSRWKNNGPLSDYARATRVASNVEKYWYKWEYSLQEKSSSDYFPPAPVQKIKDSVPNVIQSGNQKKSVYGYIDNSFSIGQAAGAPGKNNTTSIAINYLESQYNYKSSLPMGSISDYLESPFLTQVQFDSSSYHKYQKNKKDKNNGGNVSYFTNYLTDSGDAHLSIAPLYTGHTFSDIKTFPLVGIVHDCYYKADGKDTQYNTRKLFYTLGALNEDQLINFIYWVYTGVPDITGEQPTNPNPAKIKWQPYWDASS